MSAHVLRNVNALRDDGTFDGPLDIAVRDGRIDGVGRDLNLPEATTIPADGVFVMPGMIDCHTHLIATTTDPLEMLRAPISMRILEAAEMAERSLRGGVTYARDAGGADAGIAQAIARRAIPGPTLETSISMISRTGGHADAFLAGPELDFSWHYLPEAARADYLADGVDSMRMLVRRILRAGADWIKLCATGGIASDFDDPLTAELTREEIETAVAEAAIRGKRVMVHAYGGAGLDNALDAGVASIEHGTLLTEEQARKMRDSEIALVPTIAILEDDLERARSGDFPAHIAAKALAVEPRLREVVAIAHSYGLRIATGSDAIRRDLHGRNLQEIAALRRAGLPAPDCLRAATSTAAQLLGVDAQRGRIAPGQVADLIMLDADPSDCTIFDSEKAVTGVIKTGVPYVEHPCMR